MGTLCGLHAFVWVPELTHEQVIAHAATDNQGNSQAMRKGLTTKFPLCCVMMEVAARVSRYGNDLDLGWVPRDDNQHADDLSKGCFHNFNAENRVNVCLSDFPLMMEMLEMGKQFYQEVETAKREKKANKLQGGVDIWPRSKRKREDFQKSNWE
eukprot:7258651-Karenia_brevis.AAC.1